MAHNNFQMIILNAIFISIAKIELVPTGLRIIKLSILGQITWAQKLFMI